MSAATKVAEPDTVERTALAPRWKVLIHDDPITTFEFVEELLYGHLRKQPLKP